MTWQSHYVGLWQSVTQTPCFLLFSQTALATEQLSNQRRVKPLETNPLTLQMGTQTKRGKVVFPKLHSESAADMFVEASSLISINETLTTAACCQVALGQHKLLDSQALFRLLISIENGRQNVGA